MKVILKAKRLMLSEKKNFLLAMKWMRLWIL